MTPKDERILKSVLNADVSGFAKAETIALESLRRAIITGVLEPGQEIDEELIAGYMNMSRMPVRQAMGVLESEGLVKRMYKRGARVTELTAEEIEEIYHIRANLEGMALRRAVPHIPKRTLEDARRVLEEMHKADDDVIRFNRLNTAFHTMLCEPCGWNRLNTMIEQLRNNVARYIAISHHHIQHMPQRDVDHERILDACATGNAELAEQVIRTHILSAMHILLKSFHQDAWVENIFRRDAQTDAV